MSLMPCDEPGCAAPGRYLISDLAAGLASTRCESHAGLAPAPERPAAPAAATACDCGEPAIVHFRSLVEDDAHSYCPVHFAEFLGSAAAAMLEAAGQPVPDALSDDGRTVEPRTTVRRGTSRGSQAARAKRRRRQDEEAWTEEDRMADQIIQEEIAAAFPVPDEEPAEAPAGEEDA